MSSIKLSKPERLELKELHRLGFTYKKPKVIAGKADAKKQQEYLDNELRPVIDKASEETSIVFYEWFSFYT